MTKRKLTTEKMHNETKQTTNKQPQTRKQKVKAVDLTKLADPTQPHARSKWTDELGAEIMIKILSYGRGAELHRSHSTVCRSWYRYSQYPTLINIHEFNISPQSAQQFTQLLGQLPSLHTLTVGSLPVRRRSSERVSFLSLSTLHSLTELTVRGDYSLNLEELKTVNALGTIKKLNCTVAAVDVYFPLEPWTVLTDLNISFAVRNMTVIDSFCFAPLLTTVQITWPGHIDFLNTMLCSLPAVQTVRLDTDCWYTYSMGGIEFDKQLPISK